MSSQALFAIMTLIFIVASNMDYVDAERLRASNATPSLEVLVSSFGS